MIYLNYKLELERFNPKEILTSPHTPLKLPGLQRRAKHDLQCTIRLSTRQRSCQHTMAPDLDAKLTCAFAAANALLSYIDETQQTHAVHVNHLILYTPQQYLRLDKTTLQNLELLENLQG